MSRHGEWGAGRATGGSPEAGGTPEAAGTGHAGAACATPATAGPAPEAPAARPRPGTWPRLDRPLVPGLIAVLGAAGFAIARLLVFAHGNISAFILLGRHFVTNPAQLPPNIVVQPTFGYDGQFYYRLALDPANLHHTAFGITVDAPFRYTRIGYSALTWLVTFGQHQAVPIALVVVNAVAIGALGVLGGLFAGQSGRHALWGLMLPAYFGLLTSLGRDTTEPVAAVCLLGGILACRQRRPVLAAALFAYGALTRETVLAVPAAIAIVRLIRMARRRARPSADDLAWAVPAVVFAAWQLLVWHVTGQLALIADGGSNAGPPLAALIHAVAYNFSHATTGPFGQMDAWLIEFTTLCLVAAAALLSLRTSTAPAHERLAFVLYLAEVCVLTPIIWGSYNTDFRSFIEVYLLAVLILLMTPLRRLLGCIAACVIPALVVVIRRRIFIGLAPAGSVRGSGTGPGPFVGGTIDTPAGA
jgi:hypothetical protein